MHLQTIGMILGCMTFCRNNIVVSFSLQQPQAYKVKSLYSLSFPETKAKLCMTA